MLQTDERTTSDPTSRNGLGQVTEFRNEPHLDFARAENREAFERALKEARDLFPIHAPLVIEGNNVETNEKIVVVSPNDTKMALGESACASAEEADRAIDAARRAFPGWSATTPRDRAAFLMKVAAAIREKRNLLAAVEVYEAAKPWREADADVCEAIDFLEYYAREMVRIGEPQILQPYILGERNELYYVPLGIVGVIGPWNFPMAIPVGMMSAAVAAGNTVVWKPAEQTPLIIYLIMKIMQECGLPPGVVNYLPGRGETAGQRLVESPRVNMIVFTGSRAVGLQILSECARAREGQDFVKRAVTEMGGKNAIIVDASADLDAAIPDILQSVFGYSGQKCSACSRLIVMESVYAALLARLRDAIASLKVAPSWDPGCQVGPLIDADAVNRFHRYMEVGAKEGKLVVMGDVGNLREKGNFVPPAAFEGITPEHRLAREEIFAPLLAVMRARDFEDAIGIANSTEYALTGGVHSRTLSHLEKAKTAFQCGNLYLNRTITGAIVGRQPFGGYKLSGVGSKAGGPDYLKQFLVARTATENLMRHGFAPLRSDSK